MTQEFYICDLRKVWRRQKYITFWRPNNSNYAWALSWSGKYDKPTVDAWPHYYYQQDGRTLTRFPVPCAVVEPLGVEPDPGDIDGNTGPVILNTPANRKRLRDAAYAPARQ